MLLCQPTDYIMIMLVRIELYDLLREEAQKNDMPYLDLREYEYEPYFYCDVSHLGWKGWIFVNENISKYFANK